MIDSIKERIDARKQFGERIIYGILITLALLISLEDKVTSILTIIISIFGTLFVIALAETYVKSITKAVEVKRTLTWNERFDIIKDEFAIMIASEVPVLLFILTLFNILTLELAFTLSKILGILELFLFGFYFGSLLKKSFLTKFFIGTLIALFGIFIISLKLLFK